MGTSQQETDIFVASQKNVTIIIHYIFVENEIVAVALRGGCLSCIMRRI